VFALRRAARETVTGAHRPSFLTRRPRALLLSPTVDTRRPHPHLQERGKILAGAPICTPRDPWRRTPGSLAASPRSAWLRASGTARTRRRALFENGRVLGLDLVFSQLLNRYSYFHLGLTPRVADLRIPFFSTVLDGRSATCHPINHPLVHVRSPSLFFFEQKKNPFSFGSLPIVASLSTENPNLLPAPFSWHRLALVLSDQPGCHASQDTATRSTNSGCMGIAVPRCCHVHPAGTLV
jgi:hypothetical protein